MEHDLHEINVMQNRRTGLAVAQCTCGWRRAGALETVQMLAATHDLDEPEGGYDGQVKNDA